MTGLLEEGCLKINRQQHDNLIQGEKVVAADKFEENSM